MAGDDRLVLSLDTGDDDPEHTEEELRLLLDELRETDVESVERVTTGPAPDGTRAGEAVQLGTLLIGLGGAGATLPVLIGLFQDWLGRRRSGTIRLKIGEDELEINRATAETQRRVLDEFLRRHGGE